MTPYRPPRWLPGGHTQTIYPLLITPANLPWQRQRWSTADNDFIDLDGYGPDAAAISSGGPSVSPLLILFHGLEGSSRSHYALSLARTAAAIGWSCVVVHFRGCSGEINHLPRAYHSGDSAEIDWILRRLRTLHVHRRLYAVGISLGGNALLKWLGEQEHAALSVVDAAAAISAPVDLSACGHHLGQGFNRVYSHHFLMSLKRKASLKLRRYPGLFDEQRMRTANSLYAFDDVVTAPLHGFAGTEDYWRRASSKPWLRAVRMPTLLLNALNDPFLPNHALPRADEVAAEVQIEYPRAGGHVGFVTGDLPGQLAWLPRRLLHFFQNEV